MGRRPGLQKHVCRSVVGNCSLSREFRGIVPLCVSIFHVSARPLVASFECFVLPGGLGCLLFLSCLVPARWSQACPCPPCSISYLHSTVTLARSLLSFYRGVVFSKVSFFSRVFSFVLAGQGVCVVSCLQGRTVVFPKTSVVVCGMLGELPCHMVSICVCLPGSQVTRLVVC